MPKILMSVRKRGVPILVTVPLGFSTLLNVSSSIAAKRIPNSSATVVDESLGIFQSHHLSVDITSSHEAL